MQKRGRLCEKGKSAYIFAYLWRKKKKSPKKKHNKLNTGYFEGRKIRKDS